MFSTKTTIESFFPDFAFAIKYYTPFFYELLLPERISHNCPHVEFPLTSNLILISPLLAFSCIVGIAIGLNGFRSFNINRTKLWAAAFLYFGLMNLDAVFLHCFNREKTALSARGLHCLDIMFTSLSSFHLMLATLNDCSMMLRNSTSNNISSAYTVALVDGLKIFRATLFPPPEFIDNMLKPLGTCFIVTAAIVGEIFKIPFCGEFLYIGVTAVAAIFAGIVFVMFPIQKMMRDSTQLPPGFVGLLVAAAGVCGFVGAPLLEIIICDFFPMGVFRSHVTGIPIGFLGCNIGFLGLHLYLINRQTTLQSTNAAKGFEPEEKSKSQ